MSDTRNQILRVVEEDVDGCGTDAVAYVMFSKELTDEIKDQFENQLRSVKERTDECDYDTEDMIQTAIEEFNKSTMAVTHGITAEMIDAAYFGVVTF